MPKPAVSVFPYQQDARGQLFPVVLVKLTSGKKSVDAYGLIDSGATISIFRSEVADALGIDIETGTQIYLGGVGGHIRGYRHDLKIEVAGKKFVCPMVFSREYLVSFNLLGREAVFEQFRIIFEEKKNLLKLE